MKNKKKNELSEARVELCEERKRKIPKFLRQEIFEINKAGGVSIDHPALSDKEIKHAVRSKDKHARMVKLGIEPIRDYEAYASCLMGSITMGAIREFTYNFCTKLLDPKYLNPSDAKENIPLIRSEILEILTDKPSPYEILTNVMCCQFDQDLIDRIDHTIQTVIDSEDFTITRVEESSSPDSPVKPPFGTYCENPLKISEVAKHLNIHPKTIYNWAKNEYIKSHKFHDSAIMVYESEVRKYAEEKRYKRSPYKPRKKSSSGGEYKSNTGMKN